MTDTTEEIKKYVNEIIEGNNENMGKLKDLIKNFFKGKTQEDIDKIDKEELKEIIELTNILSTRNPNENLNAIDMAKLEHVYNKISKKYLWIEKESELVPENFKKFRDSLIKNINFGENKRYFIKWVDWIIKDKIDWDNTFYNNIEKDFQIKINITNYNSNPSPDLEIFIIGDKKYEYEINNILSALK